MKKINKITLILRGYSLEEAVLVAKEVSRFQCFNLEITTNTSGWEDIISELKRLEFANVPVGAGTVLDEGLLKRAINAGAEFALSPIMMTEQMLKICKENDLASVPSGFSPSEIWKMVQAGADIVKVFPAARLSPKYISDIQAPLGKIPLMVVGGINAQNINDYFVAGSEFAGIGSGICDRNKLKQGNLNDLRKNLSALSETASTRQ